MNFRKDIYGLRAIAVIAVVLFHFKPAWLPSGFAGVDVFFVISGFLMTGIIFRGIEQGNFSILKFYVVRANRIVPALAILCFTLLLFSFFFLSPDTQYNTSKAILASISFISNIIYWLESGYFAALQQFTASQDVVQRYIVTDSIEEAKKSLITNAKLVACVPIFFFAVGAGLYAYYTQNPQLLPDDFNTGGILPFYIISQMPAGVAGLIIAAIFAASQSSISSSLNSISACFTCDIYEKNQYTKYT